MSTHIIIPQNTSDASLRTIPLTLVDAGDLYTPKDITITSSHTASLYYGTGPLTSSANTIVKVSGSAGEYLLTLTQTEASHSVGMVNGWVQPSGSALTKFRAYIAPSTIYNSAATTSDTANAILSSSIEPSMNLLGWARVVGAKIAGLTTGAGTTTEVFKSMRNDGTPGKTRVTETNDATNRTARTYDTTDEV